MRICAFLQGYVPHERVGAWIATARYLEAAVADGHTVDVLIPHHRGAYTHNGVHVVSLSNHTASYAQRADVVLAIHGDASRPWGAARAYSKPYVVMVHGNGNDLPAKLREQAPVLAVFNSHALAKDYAYDGAQIVCHPVLDLAEFETTPGDKITLINATHSKGVGMFDQLARYLPDRKFLAVIGGYGVQEDLYRPNVTVMPRTRDMRAVYSRTRVLLMPSLNESWGMVAAEAACSGIPTIASDLPGIRECLDGHGIFVPPDDIDAWIDAVVGLDDDKAYARLSRRARSRARTLGRDDSVERFLAALKEIA